MSFSTDPTQFPHPLEPFFLPKSVAVIGAKDDPGSVGATLMSNLINGGYKGKIFPINPKRKEVFGMACFPSVTELPAPVDLVVIATPASTVLQLVKECVQAHVKAAVIISAGFRELGPSGEELEHELLAEARKGGLRIIGPNCLGVMNTVFNLNATFAPTMALPGNIAFISQSGALCTAVLDWSLKERIGFSLFVSIGSMSDVDWGDLLDYLLKDPHTNTILMYVESIGDARPFLSAAREVALQKPVIIMKAGKTEAATKAATSHTGALAGSDDVFEMAMRQVGILRIGEISQLFDMANFLSKQPMPAGPRLTLVTNAGGAGVMATDALVQNGGEMAPLRDMTIAQLDNVLPAAWSHGNPVDILGDAKSDRYKKAVEIIARDSNTDGVLVILSPQDMTEPELTAKCLIPYAHLPEKPIFASWMGGEKVEKGALILQKADIPTFPYPDMASALFAKLWQRNVHMKLLYETPLVKYKPDERELEVVRPKIEAILSEAYAEKRTVLTEKESKDVLALYGIPVVETLAATTVEEAVDAAERVGYPVVLKLRSKTITHKSDVGGVKLDLHNSDEVIAAFKQIREALLSLGKKEHFEGVTVQKMISKEGIELILGSSVDAQFGPVILFGAGGTLVETFKDTALALPPLNVTLARDLIEQTKVSEALKGIRGQKSVDFSKLEELLVRFSYMIGDFPRIMECDINPVLASSDQMIALDARIILHPLEVKDEQLPQFAFRPYPSIYTSEVTLENGKQLFLRPISSEDEPLLVQFHKGLSEHAVKTHYLKFRTLKERTEHHRLVRFCYCDYDRELILLAVDRDLSSGEELVVGIGRLMRQRGTTRGAIKLILSDRYIATDLDEKLLEKLLTIAKEEGVQQLYSFLLSENKQLLQLFQKLGFHQEAFKDDPTLILAKRNMV